MTVSSNPRANIQLNNYLSELLDHQHNELVERELQLSGISTPEDVLFKVLTPDPTTTTASSFANYQRTQQSLAAIYRPIGFGQCGLVFERPGRNFVLKVAKSAYKDALWADCIAHCLVREAFEQKQHKNTECRVPRVFSYVSKDDQQWWNENLPFFAEVHQSLSLPSMVLITERILPLPKVARLALINKYCPAPLRAIVASNPSNRDCLARVYLGRRRPANLPPTPNFTLRNINLFLDQQLELNLPVQLFAAAMGEALAIIHWAANVDAYDIEFVLGSEGEISYTRGVLLSLDMRAEQLKAMKPHTNLDSMMKVNCKRRTTRLWILDFNLCNTWNEEVGWKNPEALISHLVTAFFENDPYYPLPLMELDVDKELWLVFSAAYLKKAGEILREKDHRLAGLPQKFIDGCVLREQTNLAKNLGHGHREFKQ